MAPSDVSDSLANSSFALAGPACISVRKFILSPLPAAVRPVAINCEGKYARIISMSSISVPIGRPHEKWSCGRAVATAAPDAHDRLRLMGGQSIQAEPGRGRD